MRVKSLEPGLRYFFISFRRHFILLPLTMRKNAFIFFAAIVLLSCKHKKNVDLIIYNAKIYTVDSAFTVCEAMAIVNGSIEATGTSKKILADYDGTLETDASENSIYPGFIDSHCHF